jgi:hypothetical protein
MRFLFPVLVSVAMLLCFRGGPSVGQPQAAGPDEAVRVRALLVGDTGDPDIGGSVSKDLAIMQVLLKGAFAKHRDRLTLEILTDSNVTRERILGYYQKRKTGPEETLLFYFSGHGGTERLRGHLFQVLSEDGSRPVPLWRDEVRSAMLSHQPRLCILLSDVCSDLIDLGARARAVLRPPAFQTTRCLFLQARGLVDINAVSEGQAAVGQEDGGFFTRGLVEVLGRPFKELDRDGDGFLHWQEVLPAVQQTAQEEYAKWRQNILPLVKKDLARAQTRAEWEALAHFTKQLEKQRSQRVRAYHLPSLSRFGVRVVATDDGEGVRVLAVHEYTPAGLAKLKPGDVILTIAGKGTNSLREFTEAVAGAKGVVTVRYRREGKADPISVEVRLPAWRTPGVEG